MKVNPGSSFNPYEGGEKYLFSIFRLQKRSRFHDIIISVSGASLEATHIARLQGRSIFKDIRVEAEEEIHSKLISKIDEFIELANYDYVMSELQGTSSSWLSDLIAFLNSVFLSFTNLPVNLAQEWTQAQVCMI